jgi:hypothetical protein
MRVLVCAVSAALLMSAPLATAVKAEETTVIKKDSDYDGDSTTVIKKKTEEPAMVEKKTIIKKERED